MARSGETVASERGGTDAGPHALACPWALQEVVAGLRTLANNKAPGEDGMPAELLKCSGEAGARMLCKLFNTVYDTECIPSQWRKVVVTCAHKVLKGRSHGPEQLPPPHAHAGHGQALLHPDDEAPWQPYAPA